MGSDVVAVQEHHIDETNIVLARRAAWRRSWKSDFAPARRTAAGGTTECAAIPTRPWIGLRR
eukprot:4288881-Pyramimonas_sp.AAC.1